MREKMREGLKERRRMRESKTNKRIKAGKIVLKGLE